MGQYSNFVVTIILFLAIVYFMMIRPNSKQQKERKLLLSSIRPKDKVITVGGVHGTITKVKEDTVLIRVASNVDMEFSRSSVQSIVNRNYKDSTPIKEKKSKDNTVEESLEIENEDTIADSTTDNTEEIK